MDFEQQTKDSHYLKVEIKQVLDRASAEFAKNLITFWTASLNYGHYQCMAHDDDDDGRATWGEVKPSLELHTHWRFFFTSSLPSFGLKDCVCAIIPTQRNFSVCFLSLPPDDHCLFLCWVACKHGRISNFRDMLLQKTMERPFLESARRLLLQAVTKDFS